LLLAAAFVAWQREKSYRDLRPHYFYLIDSRGNPSAPIDFAWFYTRDQQRALRLRVVVTTIPLAALEASLLESGSRIVEQALQDDAPPRFYRLTPPYPADQKALRAAIDGSEVGGEMKRRLLEGIVPVINPCEVRPAYRCDDLSEDIAFAHWNFHGIAVIADEKTIAFLKNCRPDG